MIKVRELIAILNMYSPNDEVTVETFIVHSTKFKKKREEKEPCAKCSLTKEQKLKCVGCREYDKWKTKYQEKRHLNWLT